MTLEQLISSPTAYAILLFAWGFTWGIKRLLRSTSLRSEPAFKLALSVLPLLLGAVCGLLVFDFGTEFERLAAGLVAAAPAVVSYSTLRQLSELPGLPVPLRAILLVLLERSAEGRARSEGSTTPGGPR